MARILVIDDDVNLLQMVRLMLQRVGHEVETSSNGEEGLLFASQKQPDLAIIDVMMPGLSGYDVVRRLRDDPFTARIPIVILTARSQPMDKQMALEAGANAFLSKPVTAQELTDRVDAVLRAGVNYRVHTGLLTEPVRTTPPTAPPNNAPPPAPASEPARLTPAPPQTPERKPIGAEFSGAPNNTASPATHVPVITVMTLRGGTGSTTIALNLAFLLASRGRRVCLADFSTASAHIGLHLHLAPPQHWGNLLPLGDTPDARAIMSLLVQHQPSGISLLSAPPIPSMQTLSTAATQVVLRELSSTFNHVVVDAPNLDPASTGALLLSRTVIVVMSDDPPSVQTTGQFLIALHALGVEAARVRVVLNHVRPANDVPPETIQKALKRPMSAEVPYDPNQLTAIRRGVPLVISDPQCPFTQAIEQLARTMTT